jgi:hypothetical protein
MKLVENASLTYDEHTFQPYITYTGMIPLELVQDENKIDEIDFIFKIGMKFTTQLKEGVIEIQKRLNP